MTWTWTPLLLGVGERLGRFHDWADHPPDLSQHAHHA